CAMLLRVVRAWQFTPPHAGQVSAMLECVLELSGQVSRECGKLGIVASLRKTPAGRPANAKTTRPPPRGRDSSRHSTWPPPPKEARGRRSSAPPPQGGERER